MGSAILCAAPLKLAVTSFTAVGIEQATVDAYADHFVTLLGQSGSLKVTTPRDIAQVIGFERQKQLLGCADDKSSCLAELAGALGVDALLSATVARSGSSMTVTVRILRAADGSEIASATSRLRGEDALQDWLEGQVPALRNRLLMAFGRAREDVVATQSGPSLGRWVPAMGGGGLLVVGGVFFALSRQEASQLATQTFPSRAAAQSVANTGQLYERAAAGTAIAGGAAIAASAIWVLMFSPAGAPVAFAPSTQGAGVVLSGTF